MDAVRTHRQHGVTRAAGRIGPRALRPMRSHRGFTITELIVTMGVTVAVLAAGITTYLGTTRSWEGTATMARLQQEASAAMEAMARSVRGASDVVIDGDGDSLRVFFWTGSVDSLVAIYYVDDQGVMRNMAGTALVNTAESLGFSSSDGKTVNIDVLLKDERGTACASDDQAILMSSTIRCRN